VPSDGMPRPEPWGEAPPGFHFEVAPREGWLVPAIGAGGCRFGRPSCKRPPVASLLRGIRPAPWDYCERHLYGGWIEDGRVVSWRLVRDEA